MKKSLKFAFVLFHIAFAGVLINACGGDDSSPVIEHPPPDAAVLVPDAANCEPLLQNCGDGKCNLKNRIHAQRAISSCASTGMSPAFLLPNVASAAPYFMKLPAIQ